MHLPIRKNSTMLGVIVAFDGVCGGNGVCYSSTIFVPTLSQVVLKALEASTVGRSSEMFPQPAQLLVQLIVVS
eukprot:6486005-Amphidinium_carterae.1